MAERRKSHRRRVGEAISICITIANCQRGEGCTAGSISLSRSPRARCGRIAEMAIANHRLHRQQRCSSLLGIGGTRAPRKANTPLERATGWALAPGQRAQQAPGLGMERSERPGGSSRSTETTDCRGSFFHRRKGWVSETGVWCTSRLPVQECSGNIAYGGAVGVVPDGRNGQAAAGAVAVATVHTTDLG